MGTTRRRLTALLLAALLLSTPALAAADGDDTPVLTGGEPDPAPETPPEAPPEAADDPGPAPEGSEDPSGPASGEPEEPSDPESEGSEDDPGQDGEEPGEAEDGQDEEGLTIEPTIPEEDPGFYEEPEEPEVPYSVDVEWGAMTFWYVTQGWDEVAMRADTSLTGWHVYDEDADELAPEDCEINAITVRNRSENAALTAVFSYSGEEGFGIDEGVFSFEIDEDLFSGNTISLALRDTCEVHFMPATVPEDDVLTDREHRPVKIGTITVELLPPPQTGKNEDDEDRID